MAVLAGDRKGPVTVLNSQVLDVGAGGLRYPRPVQCEQRDQSTLGRRAESGRDQQGGEVRGPGGPIPAHPLSHDPAGYPSVGGRNHAFRDRHHVVGAGAGHLEIDLAELGLAIRPQVFITKAARDLIVAIEAGDHQELLQELR